MRGTRFTSGEMDGHLGRIRRDHPDLYGRLDVERARSWAQDFAGLEPFEDDFGDTTSHGRGASYLRAQAHNVRARAAGIAQLLGYIRAGSDTSRKTVVDVLGGDGLIQRVAALLRLADLSILTCDVSPYMVRAAWESNYPALLQRADFMLQRDNSVEGVLIAYGSHHIAPHHRVQLARESYRVLRPRGVAVLHDFLVGSPMDTWFTDVVDRYSRTGHKFEHFTREEIRGCLVGAGFGRVDVIEMADPYVATAPRADQAELALGRYLSDMYGLVEIQDAYGPHADRWVIDRAKEIFHHSRADTAPSEFTLRHDPRRDLWTATLPRMAVVGVATKSA
ncbi:Methyltransferase type 11 [Actinobacteria bacterium OK074]|nr:Methyltransferase type 11 [Actinobacteria bacterium OK074]